MVMEMSKTYQYRKVMKPLLERKRRARINKCLDTLKDLMVECLQEEGEHVTRLEKADILELTVEYMRKLKQRGRLSLQPQLNVQVESFRSGYVHAADQITQVLLQQQQTDEVGQKIMKFLSGRLVELQHQLLRLTTPSASISLPSTKQTVSSSSPSSPSSSGLFSPNIAVNTLFNPLDYNQSMEYPCKTTEVNNRLGDENLNNLLIDVTTVDDKPASPVSSSSSFISTFEENSVSSGEPMWRPW